MALSTTALLILWKVSKFAFQSSLRLAKGVVRRWVEGAEEASDPGAHQGVWRDFVYVVRVEIAENGNQILLQFISERRRGIVVREGKSRPCEAHEAEDRNEPRAAQGAEQRMHWGLFWMSSAAVTAAGRTSETV